MRLPKPLVITLVAALGLLSAGVVSAAVLEESDDPAVALEKPTSSVADRHDPDGEAPDGEDPDAEDPEGADPEGEEPVDDPEGDGAGQQTARYYGPECGERIEGGTHGDYVSRVARDPERAAEGMREIARSNCGKPLTSVKGAAEDGEAGETTPPPTPETSAPAPGPPVEAQSAQGHQNGHADGNANGGAGNGTGHDGTGRPSAGAGAGNGKGRTH
jgi:hypothetical protein